MLIQFLPAWSDIPPVAEAPLNDLAYINPSGYNESKWVSERIIWTASRSTSLRAVIIRVGQLCGGLNGNWNPREWFPSLVRAGQVVGGLPDNKGVCYFCFAWHKGLRRRCSLVARVIPSSSRRSFRHHRTSTNIERVCSPRASTSCSLGSHYRTCF